MQFSLPWLVVERGGIHEGGRCSHEQAPATRAMLDNTTNHDGADCVSGHFSPNHTHQKALHCGYNR